MEFDRADVLRFDPRIALVTRVRNGVPAASILRAGDPDQPRDDDGKWTDGGGGGGGGGGASREDKAEKRARTRETARAARSAAKEAARASAAVDKAEARIADLQKQADEAAETAALAIERAEAAEAEADEAEESVSDMRDWDPDDHDDDEAAPTADDIAAAETLAREKRAAANRERKNADKADRRSDALEARAQEVEDGFEDDLADLENEKDARADAENEHEYAKIDDLPSRERSAALRERVAQSAAAFETALAAADADDERHARELAAINERDQRRKDDTAARLAEADRVYRAGGDDWYERGNALQREAFAKDREERRAIERERRATLRTNKATAGDAHRAEVARDFWASADDTDPEDDAIGTAEDRDGDGLTGDEEEQDDEPESA